MFHGKWKDIKVKNNYVTLQVIQCTFVFTCSMYENFDKICAKSKFHWQYLKTLPRQGDTWCIAITRVLEAKGQGYPYYVESDTSLGYMIPCLKTKKKIITKNT